MINVIKVITIFLIRMQCGCIHFIAVRNFGTVYIIQLIYKILLLRFVVVIVHVVYNELNCLMYCRFFINFWVFKIRKRTAQSQINILEMKKCGTVNRWFKVDIILNRVSRVLTDKVDGNSVTSKCFISYKMFVLYLG